MQSQLIQPRSTFLNLEERKRKRFIEAAMKEFSMHDYESASISAIVEKLGIAKGSVYQYFGSKKELYLYLLQEAAAVKMSYLQDEINKGYSSFLELYQRMFSAGIRWDLQCPRESRLLYLSSLEQRLEDTPNFSLDNKRRSWEMMTGLLKEERKQGRLRTDLTEEVMAWQIIAVSVGIADYIQLKYGVDYLQNAKKGKPVFALSEKEIMKTVAGMIAFIKNGIEK
jgi:AcrR family transcriptional regulator